MYYVAQSTLSDGVHEVYLAKNPRRAGDKCLGMWSSITDAVYEARKTYYLVMAG